MRSNDHQLCTLYLVSIFRVQGDEAVSPSEDFDKSKYTYVWEDWVAMVTRERYNRIQTDIKPSQRLFN